jgi:hypothetical protein
MRDDPNRRRRAGLNPPAGTLRGAHVEVRPRPGRICSLLPRCHPRDACHWRSFPFTFRHLDKVGIFALEGNRPKVLSSVQRAVASAIDAPSLIKIAAVAHSEDCPEEAMTALKKALKVAARQPEMQALVRSSAATLGSLLAA